MQIYLLHYIWYIFSSVTIPIINFLGIVNSENERLFVYTVYEHAFANICSKFDLKSQILMLFRAITLQSLEALKQLHRRSCKTAAFCATKKLRPAQIFSQLRCAPLQLRKSCEKPRELQKSCVSSIFVGLAGKI